MEPPEWRSGLRHCIIVQTALLQMLVRDMHEATHNWPSIVRVRGGFGQQGRPCPIALYRLPWRARPMHADTITRCFHRHNFFFLWMGIFVCIQCIKVIFKMTTSGNFLYIYLKICIVPLLGWFWEDAGKVGWIPVDGNGPMYLGRFWAVIHLIPGRVRHPIPGRFKSVPAPRKRAASEPIPDC